MRMHHYTKRSRDNRGTEFTYTCHVNEDGSRIYCDTLFGMLATSLRDLKTMLATL